MAGSHCRSRGRGCQTWHGRATVQISRLSIRVHKIVHKHTQEQSKCMGYYTSNHKSNQSAPHTTLANTKAIKVHQILSRGNQNARTMTRTIQQKRQPDRANSTRSPPTPRNTQHIDNGFPPRAVVRPWQAHGAWQSRAGLLFFL